MKEILSELESEDIKKRLNALDELAKMVSAENIDRVLIIKALKSHIDADLYLEIHQLKCD